MAATCRMKMLVHRAGPRTDDAVGSEVEMSFSEAARFKKAGYAACIDQADEAKLDKQFVLDNKPLGEHEAHRERRPDHGPTCHCNVCQKPG